MGLPLYIHFFFLSDKQFAVAIVYSSFLDVGIAIKALFNSQVEISLGFPCDLKLVEEWLSTCSSNFLKNIIESTSVMANV